MAGYATILVALVLVGTAAARKGGNANLDLSQIVNPDPDFGKHKSREFNAGLLEGDIASRDGNQHTEDRNGARDVNLLWPQGVVPYVFDSSLSPALKKKVEKAIKDYSENTCIKFVPRNHEQDYVFVNSRESGCYAYLGRYGGQQPLNLEEPGCDDKGTIIHEMLHTIGFAHEQSRNDRDQYITINWNNMEYGMESQFTKLQQHEENNQGFGYDYYSVMHYPDWGFSKNGRPTIVTKDAKMQKVIGQRAGFSKQDVKEVNGLYKCNGKESGIGGTNESGNGECEDGATNCGRMLAQYPNACNEQGFGDFCRKTCGTC